MVQITISSAGKLPAFAKGFPTEFELLRDDATVADVKASIASKHPKFYAERQKIMLKGERKALKDTERLKDLGLAKGGELCVRDLGPQVSWRTVFLVEYFGPLLIHTFIYDFPVLVYGKTVQHSALQKYTFWLVMLHFLKRELETLFIHRFSHGTMPLFNIFKNSFYYWCIAGIPLAYDIYRPAYSASSPFIKGTYRDDPKVLTACAMIHLFFELSNLSTHLTLRNLRPVGTTKRGIPYGYGFSMISCPNYFFECLVWLLLALMTRSLAASLFFVIGGIQMGAWAKKKHRSYKKEFGTAYPKRYAMIPFIF